MSNLSKKIFAIVTTLTVSVWMVGPGVAQAMTAAELQAQIDILISTLSGLQTQLTALQGGQTAAPAACSEITFSRNLKQGMSGTDVKCLQAILNQSADTQVAASGVGSPGNETTFFGSLTKTAVVKLQVKYVADILTPVGLTKGTGFVGASSRAKLNSLLAAAPATPATPTTPTTPTTPITPGPAGENKVQLASDNPAAATVAKGAQDVVFSKINFCAASEANTVSKIILTRGGIAADADIASVKLYEGSTQIGSTQALNTQTHKAIFSSLSLVVAANSCRTLIVKASIATAATAGDTPKLGIEAAADITSTVALDGAFPIRSNSLTVAGISVGSVYVTAQGTPSGSIIAGGSEQAVATFRFYATSTEGIKIDSVKMTEVGSSVDADVSNIKLFYGTTQLGSTVASLVNGAVTFDLSASPLEILAGNNKDLTVYVDVGVGTGIATRTIRFEVTQSTNAVVYGTNSGGSVPVKGTVTSGADTWPQQGQSMTITLGTLTVAKDTALSPSAQTYVLGTAQNKMIAFRFTAGAYEGARVTQIKLHATGTAAGTDSNISNVTLYDGDTNTVIAGPAGMLSGYVTFGSYTSGVFDTTGLFDVAKSAYKQILVKADVPVGASSAVSAIGFEILNPTTDIKADGLSSQNDLASTDINAGSTTVIPSTKVAHTISAYGTLTASLNANSPSAATYSAGTTAYTLAKFDLTSTGEDILVSQINITFSTATSPSSVTADLAATADVNDVRLYDGSTLLATDPTISSGVAQFGVNLTVAKNTTKILTITGNIPTGTGAPRLAAMIGAAGDVVAKGKDSGTTLSTAGSFVVAGKVMTKGVPNITVKAATTPVAQTIIYNTADAIVTTLYLTASTTEDVSITSITVAGDNYNSFATTGTDGLTTAVENIKLFDGSTQVGSTVPTLTAGTNYDYADFTGLALLIPKGVTKSIDIKLTIKNASTNPFYFGIASSTSVAGSGVNSGTAATITAVETGVSGKGITFGSVGTLTVTKDVNSPISATFLAGATGNSFGKWKFSATNEDIKISKLVFDVTHSAAASGTSIGASSALALINALTATSTASYGFSYSLNDAATATCIFNPAATTTVANVVTAINAGCTALIASQTSNILTISASGSIANGYSLEIIDAGSDATNAADDLLLGLKYGGTENIGKYQGVNDSVVKVSIYEGDSATSKAEAFIAAETAGKVIFNFSSGSEVNISKTASKVLTLKADLSDYVGAVEGSTFIFTLGAADTDYVTNYIVGKGASSGTTLVTTKIVTTGSATSGALASNEMWIYDTKPTVSANAAVIPATIGTNQEVFRFDVAAPNNNFNVNINAIRFTVSTNATGTIFNKAFNLYKSGDSTVIGTGTSVGVGGTGAVNTATVGYVAIYPTANAEVGAGSTWTYVLKGDTSTMNKTTGNDQLTISIADGDFYWDDASEANANQKVLNLPVSGPTLNY